MIGPHLATASLASYLRETLPLILTSMRAQYSVPESTLPPPRLITPATLPELPVGSWPAIMVVATRMENHRLLSHPQESSARYEATYRMAIESYVRGTGFEETTLLRDRYATAIRSALLHSVTLRPAGASWSGAAPRVDVSSLRDDYSEIVDATRGRSIASCRTSLLMQQVESPVLPADEPAIGNVAGVHLSTERVAEERLMPRHPALP